MEHGCKYLTETKEALDSSKNKELPSPLASFYFQRYSEVHWVARTDFQTWNIPENVQRETVQVRKEQWNTENRAVAGTLKSCRHSVCACPPSHTCHSAPAAAGTKHRDFQGSQRQLQHYPAENNSLGSRATTPAKNKSLLPLEAFNISLHWAPYTGDLIYLLNMANTV